MAIRHQFQFIQLVREFFIQQQFTEAMVPPMVEHPGPDEHIHPFIVKPVNPQSDLKKKYYLHTSPELNLKRVLSNYAEEGIEQLFSIGYCFRDEPSSKTHRNQFIMLEWYRLFSSLQDLRLDTIQLIHYLLEKFYHNSHFWPKPKINENITPQIKSVEELFLEYLNISLFDYVDTGKFNFYLRKNFPQLTNSTNELPWDDIFFLLFLNFIEPHFKETPILFVTDYPKQLASLSQLNENDLTCHRFELYIHGVEVANAYQEEVSVQKNRAVFAQSNQKKKNLYQYSLPNPNLFLNDIERLPPCSGIALGIERLMMSLLTIDQPFFE
jgi:lysyl-tRNA synthetase class 2